jgi:ankyrin repeat protein
MTVAYALASAATAAEHRVTAVDCFACGERSALWALPAEDATAALEVFQRPRPLALVGHVRELSASLATCYRNGSRGQIRRLRCVLQQAASAAGYGDAVLALLATRPAVAKALRTRGAALALAAANAHLEVVAALLAAGAALNLPFGSDGEAPLGLAAAEGHGAVVRALLRARARVDARRGADGATPLSVAAQFGHAGVLDQLLQAGADPNAARADGAGPLFQAAQNGHLGCVLALLRSGARRDMANKHGATALWIAALDGDVEVFMHVHGREVADIFEVNGPVALWRGIFLQAVNSLSMEARKRLRRHFFAMPFVFFWLCGA